MAIYRILSLDGGGLRGLITVTLLERLKSEAGLGGWLDQVDLFAGTSTGGLLALGMASGLGTGPIRDLYIEKGDDIFDDSIWDNIIDLGVLIGAQYGNKKLKKEIKKILGETTLGDLPRSVLITTFDLDNEDKDPHKRTWKPKIFHNIPGGDADTDILAYKAALYTSAAPTYFPAVDGYIDGGVYANNPSMCALASTQDKRNSNPASLPDIRLLSLGTGTALTYMRGKRQNWGVAQWVQPLISLMMDGTGGIADYQCSQILGDHYHRLAPCFDPGVAIPIDDPDRLEEMVEFANNVDISPVAKWLKKQWV